MTLRACSLVVLAGLLVGGCSESPPPFGVDAAVDTGPVQFDVQLDIVMPRDRPPTPEVIDLTDVQYTDAMVSNDVPCATAIPAEISYGRDGGNVASTTVFSLRPPTGFVAVKTPAGMSPVRCETVVPPCNNPSEVDLSEVAAAMSHPEVASALETARANGNMVLYGLDPRPVDGQVFYFEQGGVRVLVGEPCRTGSGTGCTTAPVGVQRLVDVLNALSEQELLRSACAPLRN